MSRHDLPPTSDLVAPPLDGVKKKRGIREDNSDVELNGSNKREEHHPRKRVRIASGQRAHQDLVEAQMEGAYAISGDTYPQNASKSSRQAWGPLETLSCAPPQLIRVARFAKDQMEPTIVEKQTIDVKADQHRGDSNLNHIPDFRKDWGNNEKWKAERRAERFFVAPDDFPDFPQLHGWYVVFSLHESRYDKNTHILAQGFARHLHEDIFIARLGAKTFHNGWTCYVDMPKEFLSATTKEGWNLYRACLRDHKKSMLSSLIA